MRHLRSGLFALAVVASGSLVLRDHVVRAELSGEQRDGVQSVRRPPHSPELGDAVLGSRENACSRGPTPATARRNTTRSGMRWRSSSGSATSRACGTHSSAPTRTSSRRAQEDRRHAGQRRTEPRQRGRDLLCRPSRRAARCRAEGRAPAVRSRRPWLRGAPRRADRVRVVAGVRRADRGALRRAPDYRSRAW